MGQFYTHTHTHAHTHTESLDDKISVLLIQNCHQTNFIRSAVPNSDSIWTTQIILKFKVGLTSFQAINRVNVLCNIWGSYNSTAEDFKSSRMWQCVVWHFPEFQWIEVPSHSVTSSPRKATVCEGRVCYTHAVTQCYIPVSWIFIKYIHSY
jgi:hypothetical protein